MPFIDFVQRAARYVQCYLVQFKTYFDYVKALEYEEEPDYVWIKRLFKDLFD